MKLEFVDILAQHILPSFKSTITEKPGSGETQPFDSVYMSDEGSERQGTDRSRLILRALAETLEIPRKKKVIKRKVEWRPQARAGELKSGLEVMGRLKITDETTEVDSPTQTFSLAALSMELSSGNAGGRLQIVMAQVRGQGDDTPRIEGGEALHNLVANGLVADGLSDVLKGEHRTQPVRELNVRTNGTGMHRVQSIRAAGLLDINTQVLGSFQRLDASPDLPSTDTRPARKVKDSST